MLVFTPTAIEVVRTITSAEGVPDGSGLRIAATTDGGQPGALEMSITPGPEEDDQVLAGEGTHVFLDPLAAVYLDDKILDAEVTDDGQVAFALGEQQEQPTEEAPAP
ncbi:iron-sulfur cluster biosynthesis family protein [Allokutzneria multivorans]|uniref:Iron-sulfur cluster biosynthesis family protein n=1 Tax=Allokutzneria multivorans TaxID=1142134 RepID=A0ABP7S220_9PSEU